jgi:S1-C subfamily serine protease
MVRARDGERSPSTGTVVVAESGVEQVAQDGTVRTGLFVTEQVDPIAVATTVATLTATAPGAGGSADGAVFDDRGRLLGLVIGNDGDGAQVAQPATVVRSVAESLIERGRVERAWIGIEATDLGRDEAVSRALDGGAVVLAVNPDGPAARAGLVEGDVVVAVDGRPVARMEELVTRLQEAGPGRSVEITWIRGTERRSAPVAIETAQP